MLFQVSFDVYNMAYDALPDGLDFSGSDDESTSCGGGAGPGAAINRCGGQEQIFSNSSFMIYFSPSQPHDGAPHPAGRGRGRGGADPAHPRGRDHAAVGAAQQQQQTAPGDRGGQQQQQQQQQ